MGGVGATRYRLGGGGRKGRGRIRGWGSQPPEEGRGAGDQSSINNGQQSKSRVGECPEALRGGTQGRARKLCIPPPHPALCPAIPWSISQEMAVDNPTVRATPSLWPSPSTIPHPVLSCEPSASSPNPLLPAFDCPLPPGFPSRLRDLSFISQVSSSTCSLKACISQGSSVHFQSCELSQQPLRL